MPLKTRMVGSAPAQKVVASSVGAALAQIILWGVVAVSPIKEIPQGLESSLTVLMAFLLGYLTPPSARDQIIVAQDQVAAAANGESA